MVTRLSHLFLRTLRDDPSDAEVRSHKLLVRAGYIRRQAPGIFAWLPLGLRVKGRIEAIVRQEMTAAGAQEVHFPALLPREPYEATNRWTEYGDGIFRLQDRKGADYLLAPTHEEMFALIVKDLYSSYKDLPVTLFQIQDKYRDEARPRAGLLRGREFTMKDAYSFDIDDAGLDASYQVMRDAYERIFTRLGLEYVIVQADAGAMGGSRSEEFLHPIAVGEDTFVRSAGGYAANIEAYTTPVPEASPTTGLPAPVLLPVAETPTIASLVEHANAVAPRDGSGWSASDTLKNVVLALTHLDGTREIVVVGLPGDREVELKRAEVAFAPAEVEPATDADFAKHRSLVKGYIGPTAASFIEEAAAGHGTEGSVRQFLGADSETGLRYFLDPRVVDGTTWITGANTAGRHVSGLVAGRDFVADGVVEVADVRPGDPAPDGSGPLETARGMEIGHVFQLGRKYAEALGLKVQDERGKLATVTMGSYGIGITRIMAILAEAHNDDRGLVWPKDVAPFDVHVVATGKDQVAYDVASGIIAELERAGMDVLYDDRPKVSPGVKFGDAELIGVPVVVVAGRNAGDGVVELWDRAAGERREVPVAEVLAAVRAI
ncbi:proline--tRNA ligase [Curtobacterium sp. MCBD17_034]|uniref:proline--tRNA ligase n=1 Tax=unclassified Curtobacterium TaxID=257496 RepID=UPI000DA81221|nr:MULTISPECIES: proline--tRNA ligase [unclassified Curtobacterium]PZE77196.1 proline--tRNA ligase [Curtobacterium sp. MCBD17_019]PZF59122.1 proline--tRNA ligase [Curtobacterium sp. MCBD17_034]PZF65225.1 proline--tRNA ligase [Curtobacterium sp. MCBD17_013]PZM34335.1 proline--tRNA ligase [Curtobacterium sp. MCBD17_031]WIE53317.1 proline--tRNA ligase [Curtobacterium sp. MCBD17_003]